MANIIRKVKGYAKKQLKKIDTKKIKKIIEDIPEKSTMEFVGKRMKIQLDDRFLYDKVSRNDRIVARRMKRSGKKVSNLLLGEIKF